LEKGIALKYDKISPRVMAKARGEFLKKMLQIADNNGITVYRDPDLTEVLYKIDTGDTVPEELFKAVAVVMAYCYNVNLDFKRKIQRADY